MLIFPFLCVANASLVVMTNDDLCRNMAMYILPSITLCYRLLFCVAVCYFVLPSITLCNHLFLCVTIYFFVLASVSLPLLYITLRLGFSFLFLLPSFTLCQHMFLCGLSLDAVHCILCIAAMRPPM